MDLCADLSLRKGPSWPEIAWCALQVYVVQNLMIQSLLGLKFLIKIRASDQLALISRNSLLSIF